MKNLEYRNPASLDDLAPHRRIYATLAFDDTLLLGLNKTVSYLRNVLGFIQIISGAILRPIRSETWTFKLGYLLARQKRNMGLHLTMKYPEAAFLCCVQSQPCANTVNAMSEPSDEDSTVSNVLYRTQVIRLQHEEITGRRQPVTVVCCFLEMT